MTKPITFRASFPPIQSAFKRHGGGDGFRIQLDIPECDMGEAAALMALTNCVLVVTVEVEAEHCKTVENNAVQTGAKRKSEWATT